LSFCPDLSSMAVQVEAETFELNSKVVGGRHATVDACLVTTVFRPRLRPLFTFWLGKRPEDFKDQIGTVSAIAGSPNPFLLLLKRCEMRFRSWDRRFDTTATLPIRYQPLALFQVIPCTGSTFPNAHGSLIPSNRGCRESLVLSRVHELGCDIMRSRHSRPLSITYSESSSCVSDWAQSSRQSKIPLHTSPSSLAPEMLMFNIDISLSSTFPNDLSLYRRHVRQGR